MKPASHQFFRHEVVVHDEAAAEIGHDGLRDGEAVALVAGDGFRVPLVHGENQPARAKLPCFLFTMFQQQAAEAASVRDGEQVKFVELHHARLARRAKRGVTDVLPAHEKPLEHDSF